VKSFHFSVLPALLVGAVLALLAAPAVAAVVVDQNQPDNSLPIVFINGGAAQSFQQTADNIAGAGIYLASGRGLGSADITIALWSNLPPSGGTLNHERNGDNHYRRSVVGCVLVTRFCRPEHD
jgi:hypothetical protein